MYMTNKNNKHFSSSLFSQYDLEVRISIFIIFDAEFDMVSEKR